MTYKQFYVVFFLIWRLAYDAVLGYLLYHHSKSCAVTNYFCRIINHEVSFYGVIKKLISINMGPDYDYKVCVVCVCVCVQIPSQCLYVLVLLLRVRSETHIQFDFMQKQKTTNSVKTAPPAINAWLGWRLVVDWVLEMDFFS